MSDDTPQPGAGPTGGSVRADHRRAMAAGREMDLSDCLYKGAESAPDAKPPGYYSFLAGLVRTRSYCRIVEVGTHHGGSTQALCRGIPESQQREACVVTIDITRFNEEALGPIPFLHRVQGDSLLPEVQAEVCAHFDGPIDLLYVDSFHQHRETLQNIAVFANRLHPAAVVVDDIVLNPPMRALWAEVVALDGAEAFDVSALVRRRSVGFGIVECEPTLRWPEVEGGRLTAWLAWRRAHRTLDRVVPEAVQEKARPALIRLNARLRRSPA